MELHSHEFHELVMILAGRGIHITADEEYPVWRGHCFLVRPGEAHGYRQTAGLTLANILYCPERLQLPEYDLRTIPGYHRLFVVEPALRRNRAGQTPLQLTGTSLVRATELLQTIECELADGQPGFQNVAAGCLLQLIAFLCRSHSGSTGNITSSNSATRLSNLLSHLEANYQKPLSLAKMATMAGLTPHSLIREFQRVTGKTPVDYLLNLRITNASRLLRHSDLRINEVATRVGFHDSNYFSRQFRNITGLSPREYRLSQSQEGKRQGKIVKE
jgi:AraC family L-rhamnose operon transcriptional activator RhaR/AraC family L-rhamnose operon regulatory protein RhaS